MVKHIVMWDFKPELGAEERQESFDKIKKALTGLKGNVEGLIDIAVTGEFLPSSNLSFILDSTFENEQGLKNYQTHPKHVEIGQTVRRVTTNRRCADFIVE